MMPEWKIEPLKRLSSARSHFGRTGRPGMFVVQKGKPDPRTGRLASLDECCQSRIDKTEVCRFYEEKITTAQTQGELQRIGVEDVWRYLDDYGYQRSLATADDALRKALYTIGVRINSPTMRLKTNGRLIITSPRSPTPHDEEGITALDAVFDGKQLKLSGRRRLRAGAKVVVTARVSDIRR